MKTVSSYLRVFGFIVVAYVLLEYTTEDGALQTIINYPVVWAILGMIVLFAIALEVVVEALKSILFRGLNQEAQKSFLANQALRKEQRFGWFKKTYKKLLGSKPIAQEGEIILDHNYDGIKELDNNLPPWWVYMFYGTILFAVIYMVRFEVIGDYNQIEEYEAAVAEANIEIEEYKKTAKDLVDATNVVALTDASDLNAGKAIFTNNCVACHKADGGGGIGPNLTDAYWILGGGIKNIFHTISEGGRSGKGMVPWKNDLKPSEMAQVASYVLTFQGVTPAEPKAAEGEIWTDPNIPAIQQIDETNTIDIDSVAKDTSTLNN